MTILELIQKTTAYFEKAGVPNPRLDVELLLAHILRLKRMELYLQFERVLTDPELDQLRPQVKRRAGREPLQHILGSVDFCGLEFLTTPAALIPRPETELLVQTAVRLLGKESRGVVLDLGTGGGAIALAVANACPGARCVATDIAEESLVLARTNAEKTALQDRVEFRRGNWFEPLTAGETFDLIVSNPPYIPSGEIPALQPEVRHDPPQALDGGPDGLDAIRKLAAGAIAFLKTGGHLLLEMGAGQDVVVWELLEARGYSEIAVIADLQKIPRIAQARKP
ncbi:MAG: peptide chain release factor N(5)-glutamine methyltransferase [Verrucomicrobia bacterium]|nr:peptide chain release factor N(5)-glutamine methyltransferase [Verrucomicrobiota bacterium]